MKRYHAVAHGIIIGDHTHEPPDELNDVFVPIEEVNDPAGRHVNCPVCAEAMAQALGGSLLRPEPPPEELWAT